MSFGNNEKPKFEKIECELAKKGYLDRLSLSVNEKKICFEFQKGFKRKVPGRVLYLADFDKEKESFPISNPLPIKMKNPPGLLIQGGPVIKPVSSTMQRNHFISMI